MKTPEHVLDKRIIDGTGGILWLIQKGDVYFLAVDNPLTQYSSGALLMTHSESEARRVFARAFLAMADGIEPDLATIAMDEAERLPYQMKQIFNLQSAHYER